VQIAVGEVAVLCGLGTVGGLLYIRHHRVASPVLASEVEIPPA